MADDLAAAFSNQFNVTQDKHSTDAQHPRCDYQLN